MLMLPTFLKRRDEPYVGPDGYFNSTNCPKEFYLRMGGHTSYSHLTVAEINGGIDGLLMAEFSHEWQRTSGRLVAFTFAGQATLRRTECHNENQFIIQLSRIHINSSGGFEMMNEND